MTNCEWMWTCEEQGGRIEPEADAYPVVLFPCVENLDEVDAWVRESVTRLWEHEIEHARICLRFGESVRRLTSDAESCAQVKVGFERLLEQMNKVNSTLDLETSHGKTRPAAGEGGPPPPKRNGRVRVW